jgi:hypothetical protein
MGLGLTRKHYIRQKTLLAVNVSEDKEATADYIIS